MNETRTSVTKENVSLIAYIIMLNLIARFGVKLAMQDMQSWSGEVEAWLAGFAVRNYTFFPDVSADMLHSEMAQAQEVLVEDYNNGNLPWRTS